MSLLEEIILQDGCLNFVPTEENHEVAHNICKKRNLTAVYCAWHPEPSYRVFRTGSLLSRNEEYPSGLVIVDESGTPTPWKTE